ncbi:MAG: hypothetical protein V7637_1067 [Mycobacteriales bacterium]|jgi:hypothetical protein
MLLRFGGIFFVIMLALWLYCLLDAISADQAEVRSLPKVAWVFIVLLTFEVGAVLWLLLGRPRRSTPKPAGRARPAGRYDSWSTWTRPATGSTARSGRPAPDDDPEFLAGLGRRANDEHKHLLDQWEADLRRREEELRRKETDEGSSGPPDEPGHDR